MSSVRQVADRFDEFKRSGFEDEQARVIAMAIDETVEDRLNGVLAHIDARFDAVDAQFKAIDTRFSGMESQIKALSDRLSSRKYEIVVITATFCAALTAVGIALS